MLGLNSGPRSSALGGTDACPALVVAQWPNERIRTIQWSFLDKAGHRAPRIPWAAKGRPV